MQNMHCYQQLRGTDFVDVVVKVRHARGQFK